MATDTPSERELAKQLADLPAEARERIYARVKLDAPVDSVDLPLAVPLDVDYSKAAPPPRWVIENIIERETVAVWAGDGGSAKSTAAQAAAVAAVTGGDWLGREVSAETVLYIDEENPQRVPHARMRALGMKNEYTNALRYFNRQGILLGTDEYDDWLRGQLAELRPDLVFIDGAQAATNVEVNDNDSVVRILSRLKVLAAEFDCAIVLLHHSRKPALGVSDDDGMSTMGARQWHNQADTHLTFRRAGPFESERRNDGGDDTRREFTIRGHKARMDGESAAELMILTSGRSASKALEWMALASGGPVSTRQDELAAAIIAAVGEADREVTTSEVAAAVGEDSEDATFRRALKATHSGRAPRVEKVKRGHYAPRKIEAPSELAEAM